MASSGSKRCLYEVLNLPIDSTADQIRSAYRKAALIRHPDKLIQSGLSQAEATASFQELVNAYEVLSDPKERAWYDSHRSQILFSDPRATAGGNNATVPDLFSFFSNTVFLGYSDTRKGFYNVYSDVFDRVYANELNYAKKLGLGLVDCVKEAPLMGNLESPYAQATAFYSYWLGFGTVMDFCWVDQYDAMAGVNRKSRRVMEEENKKVRKKARREYNETVRGLAEFVKKRDKRVIDMQVKKGLEMEKKREVEKEKKREMEKARLERAMAYEEPEWAKADEEIEGFEDDELDESEKRNELYCVVCGKKFKSEKQWKNHEQSKKHKEKVAELGGTFEDELNDEVDENNDLGVTKDDSSVDELKDEARNEGNADILSGELVEDDLEDYVFVTKDVIVLDELDDQFKDSCDIGNGDAEAEAESIEEEVNEDFGRNFIDKTKGGLPLGSDAEKIDLESMLSGRRNRKKAAAMNDNSEKVEFMEYDNRKNTRRSKTGKKVKGMKVEAESTRAEENKGDESSEMGESSSHSVVDSEANGTRNQHSENDHMSMDETEYRKAKTKKELNPKSKHLAKGKKSKATKRNDEHLCDTCGEDFDSRNKLHKHLGETGHASLKYR